MPRKQSYADHLTEERSKERLKDAVFVKCSECENLTGPRKNRCNEVIHDQKITAPNAPRLCSHFKPEHPEEGQ